MKKNLSIFILILFLFFNLNTTHSQTLDYLEKSTSEDIFTSHNFHASAYHDGHFYLAGEFWKDIAFGNFSVSFPPGVDDTVWSFILKISETGEVKDLWHFGSLQFTRLNQIAIDPMNETLTLIGQFRKNIVYNNTELSTPFFGDGFILNINLDGSLNWTKQVYSQSDVSFASGEAMAIDDAGNIFAGFEIFGNVNIDGEQFSIGEEMQGALIIKLNNDGSLIKTQAWYGNSFENSIDIVDICIDENGDPIIAGGLNGEMEINGQIIDVPVSSLQSFVIKENSDLDILLIKQYIGGNSLVNDLHIFDSKIIISMQYHNFLNLDNMQITGSGSWGDLAILSIDENGNTELMQNLRLTQNGGTSGVYAFDMTAYLGDLYIGGMYQGSVENEEGTVLDNGGAGGVGFQFPFIISLNMEGDIISSYDFGGSVGPCRLRTLESSEHRLLFSGEFSKQINFENEIIQTVNSTLFYGALWDNINDVDELHKDNNSCIENINPTIVRNNLNIELSGSLEKIWIVDSAGKIVQFISEINQLQHQLKLIDLSPGIYFLNVECSYGKEVFRIIKK